MIIVPGDAVTGAITVAAGIVPEIAASVADAVVAIGVAVPSEVAVRSVAIEASDATIARSLAPTDADTRVRHISVRMFEWPPLLAPPRSRSAAVM
jgi:hypothetical protein